MDTITVDIVTECPFCGKTHIVNVSADGYFAWKYEGVSAQDAFPELTANAREMLISGICPKCWDSTFGDEDEYDEEEDWE